MKLQKPHCPKCGKPAYATVDTVYAIFSGPPRKGVVHYSGTTDLNTQSMLTDSKTGHPTVTCENGHWWSTKINDIG